MPSELALIIKHGSFATPLLLEKRITRKANGLDTGTLSYLSGGIVDAFTTGSVITDAPGLRIEDVDREQDGGDYLYTLSVLGIDGSKGERQLPGYPRIQHNLSDWDHAEDAYLTANPLRLQQGGYGSMGGTMICTAAESQRIAPGWYEVRGQFTGIITPKPMTRQITVNGNTISGDKITVNMPGGWTTPQKSNVQLPKLVVRDRYYGSTPPPYGLIPGNATPPGSPMPRIINGTTAGDITHNWPHGWTLSSLAGEQLGNASLWAVDWIYEYNWPVTPG